MTDVRDGDKVTITIEGTVEGSSDYDHAGCTKIRDTNRFQHFVYLPAVHTFGKPGVTIVKTSPEFVSGKAYEDADGDVFIRNRANDGWVDVDADKFSNGYPTRPLRRLVREVP